MTPEHALHFKKLQEFWQAHYQLMESTRAAVLATTNLRDLADVAYFARKAGELADDVRKESEKTCELASKMACLIHTKMALNDPIKTEFVTASPDVKMQVTIPTKKKDPEAYAALMKHYGVPEALWAGDDEHGEVVRFHWPNFQAKVSEDLANGKPTPQGIDLNKAVPKFSLSMRAKKDPCD